jgi:SAM-dependent methyltransferase
MAGILELADLCTPWCIHVVATLRIADHIASGITRIDALAAAAGADREALDRVLRHLVSRGVFERPEPGRFALNAAARELLNAPVRLGLNLDGFGGRMAHAWATLLSAVRTGQTAYHEAFGRPYWDDLDCHPEIAEAFDELMGPAGHGIPDPSVLPDPSQWQCIRTVVDVGGGTGALLAEILRAHPAVRGTLVDLPRTVARAGEVFIRAGVADRVTITAQSFFDPLPSGADLYVLKSVLCDWPDAEALAILRRCAEAASPHGTVVILTEAGPGEEASPELLMLVLVGGKARTLDELSYLSGQAGLALRAVGRQRSGKVLAQFGVPAGTSSGNAAS